MRGVEVGVEVGLAVGVDEGSVVAVDSGDDVGDGTTGVCVDS